MSRDAVVVGINTYEAMQPLGAPAIDAQAVAQLLEKYGNFQVKRFPEIVQDDTLGVGKKTKVSLTKLEKALVRLFLPEGKSIPDTALFYFSGHGLRKSLGIQEGYLATSDTNPDMGNWGIRLKWLRELLQESPVRQQIIWLDCCHSGELLNFTEADPGERGKGRDRCFIAASREFEVAYEDISDPHSVMTKALLAGLDPRRCPNRWVTNYSLVDFLNQELKGATQRPIFTNFGEPIDLTRSWEAPAEKTITVSKEFFCPYKGLAYFDCNEEDPKYFYGRNQLTDQLLDQVRQGNFLAILGASGSGKSSVLRAGLLHQLKLGQRLSGSDQWDFQVMVPGDRPMQNFAQAFLDPDLHQLERAEQLGRVEGLLSEGADGLRRLVQSSKAPKVLLVIDQFEEAFTLCQDKSEREQFFACLLGALEQTEEKLCLILAMRADFFGKCVEQEYSGLAAKIKDNLIPVTPMNREQLRDAIALPVERVNLKVEEELIEQMLRDIEGSPGSLPLLQYTLTELWKRRTNNCLKLATYSKLGGIGGTLDRRASEVYQKFDQQQQEAAKHIFLCLTQLGEGTEDTRRRVFKGDLVTVKHPEDVIDGVVQELANEKLIVTSEMLEKGSADNRVAVVDVAHEALIRNWQQLRQWLNESRESLLQQRRIETAATEWRNQNQKPDYLLRGRQLREAREFKKEYSTRFPLSERAGEFIKNSLRHERISLFKGIGIFLIVPILGTYFVFREIQLNSDKELIRKCAEKKDCHGRIEALERLVEAKRSLKSYNLKSAYLKSAYLKSAYLESAYLESAYLKGANLEGTNLKGANLEGANLEGANLEGAILKGAILKGAILEVAKLNGANLNGAYLNSANLEGAYLEGAKLNSANLKSANLKSVYLKSANLKGANLEGAILEGAYLENAILEGAILEGAKLNSAYLKSANLEGAILEGAILEGANLEGAKLNSPNLEGANLEGAILKGAILKSAILKSANLKSANLKSANLKSANLKSANLKSANLKSANLKSANLEGAILEGAILEGAILLGANLKGANLEGANLEGTGLNIANLEGANLKSANLEGAYLFQAPIKLTQSQIKLTQSQIKLACYWEKAIYKKKWVIDEEATQQYIDQLKNMKRWVNGKWVIDEEANQQHLDQLYFPFISVKKWVIDEEANQQYIDQLKKDKASDPHKPVDCSRWEEK